MRSRSAIELLLLPVQLANIRLGQPVDLLLDAESWRVIGFVVLCGDGSKRFLPYAAADVRDKELAVSSALLLLEDVAFYRGRSRSLRAVLGGSAVDGRNGLGRVRDLLLARDGTVDSLIVEQDGAVRGVEPGGMRIEYVSAA